jgi:hypothetical protein
MEPFSLERLFSDDKEHEINKKIDKYKDHCEWLRSTEFGARVEKLKAFLKWELSQTLNRADQLGLRGVEGESGVLDDAIFELYQSVISEQMATQKVADFLGF